MIKEDLSNDTELFPVRVWNDVNDEPAPDHFTYITGLEDADPDYVRTPCVSLDKTKLKQKHTRMSYLSSRNVSVPVEGKK